MFLNRVMNSTLRVLRYLPVCLPRSKSLTIYTNVSFIWSPQSSQTYTWISDTKFIKNDFSNFLIRSPTSVSLFLANLPEPSDPFPNANRTLKLFGMLFLHSGILPCYKLMQLVKSCTSIFRKVQTYTFLDFQVKHNKRKLSLFITSQNICEEYTSISYVQ